MPPPTTTGTSPPQAMRLLLVAIAVMISAASAAVADVNNNNDTNNKMKRTLPGSCLMAASTLCANADTNAMRCLRKLAIKGDARVPSACSEAIMAAVTLNPRRKQTARATRVSRLLTEGGACAGGNTCLNTFGSHLYDRCNDVASTGTASSCRGCDNGTYTVLSGQTEVVVVRSDTNNPSGIACSNICCKASVAACCISLGGTRTSVFCRATASCGAPLS